ncbi:MAG: carbohydrate ABC transporter permease [Firmicutes bacterium]|nr:carbohydrate ABC transporter permease [Bacillota bacterium]
MKRRKQAAQLVSHLILVFFGLMFILPLVTMLTTAVKPDRQIFAWPPVWIPHPRVWGNFPRALTFVPMLLYAKNTIIITALNVVGVLISSPLVAYGLARIDWQGRNILFLLIVSTMMVPYQVTMIPVYLLFNSLGWINTYLPLVVPSFFGNAFFIFLLRQFFMTIPGELSDAARIDGCSELGIYRRIILPLAKPSLAVVALFQFIWVWNDFLGPLIYLKDQTRYTLSLGLQQFQSGYQTEWALLMASATMMTMPIIILFFFTQRTFIQGITLTGIKG